MTAGPFRARHTSVTSSENSHLILSNQVIGSSHPRPMVLLGGADRRSCFSCIVYLRHIGDRSMLYEYELAYCDHASAAENKW